MEYLLEVGERDDVTLQVAPFSAGLHGLTNADVMFLRLPDGRTVAYAENGYRGELIKDSVTVERLQRAYDSVRDLALSPAESRRFILRILEEVRASP
ncbi:Helix-turn-helix domain protein [Streptomyces microflavus DSM 40593]|uniref:Helix-turn-helix domain protein n=1 Tax=Streptomyces microflavus DSM 40593 TaxID=1303692 RepID=N0CX48_STRMI|nr:Helix-turn-helix domain protein [Streptomyces microflavus DSM 40593]